MNAGVVLAALRAPFDVVVLYPRELESAMVVCLTAPLVTFAARFEA